MRIHRFGTVTSTNDLARSAHYRHGDVLCAERQTDGRGQRGHTWSSAEGENLLFTAVVEAPFLPVNRQFLLSEAVALSLTDLFASLGVEARIKWTNDIYAGDRKAVGILIEHVLAGDRLQRSIVGIGINVNQRRFDPSLPNPTSLALETGRTFDREAVLEAWCAAFGRRFAQLEAGRTAELEADYRTRMYRLGGTQRFRLPDGGEFEGVIRGVRPDGALRVEGPDGRIGEYLFRQIEFVVKNAAAPLHDPE